MDVMNLDKKFIHIKDHRPTSAYPDWYYNPETDKILIPGYNYNREENFLQYNAISTNWNLKFRKERCRTYILENFNTPYKQPVVDCVLERLKYLNINISEVDTRCGLKFKIPTVADDTLFKFHFFNIIRIEKNKYKYDRRKRAKKRNRR